MKTKNRLKVEKLFIFGAGASYCASLSNKAEAIKTTAPFDNKFPRVMCELDAQRPKWVGESQKYLKDNWRDYTASFGDLGLEATIIKQLGNMEFIDAIHKRRKSVSRDEYLQHVTRLIAFVLSRAKENKNALYEQLLRKLAPRSKFPEDTKHRFITFNYDTLLDNRFLTRDVDPRKLYFDRILVGSATERERGFHFREPLLLKLHGSINWNCSETAYDDKDLAKATVEAPYFIDEIRLTNPSRGQVGKGRKPVIVPPLPEKPLTSISLFNHLWTKAFEYLHEAKELVICGYSLPEADRLAVSLFGTFTNKNLKRVWVVDPNPDILRKWQGILKRKNVSKATWTYCADFQEYVDQMPTQKRMIRRRKKSR